MIQSDNWLPSQQELHDMEEAEHTQEFWDGVAAAQRERRKAAVDEGPTGCLDDGDALSLALRRVEPERLEQILDEELSRRTPVIASTRMEGEGEK